MTALTAHERLRRGLDQIHNPVALATKYLASRNLLGGPDHDDLMDIAIQAIINAALAWDPNGGRSILSWAYLYMDRDVYRAIGKRQRERSELTLDQPDTGDTRWLSYDPGFDWYDRIELRIDLQRWADLAELTDFQRFCVQYAAYHWGVYVRDTPLAGEVSPLHGSGGSTYKTAVRHMRKAAITNQRRDDKWTRARAKKTAEATA